MIRRILVAISGSADPEAKIRAAIELARVEGGMITLMAITDIQRLQNVGPVPIGGFYYAQQMRQHGVAQSHSGAERGLQRCARACTDAGIESRIIRVDGDPVENLIAAWRYQDLLLLSLRHWFDEDVVGEAPSDAPLRLIAGGVRPLIAVSKLFRPVRQVLVAYNGSLESAKAMKHFVQSALWPNAALHIICVGPTKSGERPESVLDEAARYCAAHNRKATAACLTGAPIHMELLREANRIHADMIVMGSSYQRVLLCQRFGKNAAGLLKASPVPLFLSH